jgi:RNA polymerase sigma factor (sigma-70 family)
VESIPTAQLVAAASHGDTAAWDALVERYDRLVWAVARSFRLSDADAADVSQTTWLRLVEKLATIRDPERLAGWLATTARREALRSIRLADRESPVLDEGGEPSGQDPTPDLQNPETLALLGDEYRRLWQAYAKLPENCRRLLSAVSAAPPGGYAEVAAVLDMPIGSIGPTRGRCLKHLRRLMAEEDQPAVAFRKEFEANAKENRRRGMTL